MQRWLLLPPPREKEGGRRRERGVYSLENLNQRLDWRASTEECRVRHGTENGDCLLHSEILSPTPPCFRTQAHLWISIPLFQQGAEDPLWRHWTNWEEELNKLTFRNACWECQLATWLAQLIGYLTTELPISFFLLFLTFTVYREEQPDIWRKPPLW